MKLLILGKSGMLGGMADRYFRSAGYEVESPSLSLSHDAENMGWEISKLAEMIGRNDAILNCIGAIKPKFKSIQDLPDNIYVNAIFPHLLANIAEPKGKWLVHITTDCVWDGMRGKYTENYPHNATDEYGKSKSLGEPPNCLVLRTSIIGPEWHGRKRSLVEWLLSKNGGTVDGYVDHLWNGLTTLELCKAVDKIFREDLFQYDSAHLHSTDVTKADLLNKMCLHWGLNIKVNSIISGQPCDRTLRTIKKWQEWLKPAPIDDMLKEITPYVTTI